MQRILFAILIFAFLSCEEIIEVPDISNATIETLAPANEANITSENVVFSWTPIENAESYRLQISEPSFEAANQILLDSLVISNSFSQSLDSGVYEWRVRGENSAYVTVYSTNSFSVNTMTNDISLEAVELLAPANGLTLNENETIIFSWSAVEDATSYNIQIATPSFGQAVEIIEDVIQSESSFSIQNLDAQDYEWRVRAINSVSQTNYTTQNFTVEE